MERRYVEIDALKATAIATIILIHCVRPPWAPGIPPIEVWIGHVTRFGVPAFLFASGYLYATTAPVSLALTGRRLRRILVPYAVVSLAAQAWWSWLGIQHGTGSLWRDLAFGASMTPFYYVFVIAGLVAVTPGIARLPAAARTGLTGVMLAAQWLSDAALAIPMPIFWHFRSPLMWWAFFLIGWQVRLHRDSIAARIEPRRTAVLAGLALAVVGLAWVSGQSGPSAWIRSAAWLNIYAVIALIYVIAFTRTESSAGLRFLSDTTYAIFLLHLFFVTTVQRHLPLPVGQTDILRLGVTWLAGGVGSLIVIVSLRGVLRGRSRDWIGA